jgi:hypothetical protein
MVVVFRNSDQKISQVESIQAGHIDAVREIIKLIIEGMCSKNSSKTEQEEGGRQDIEGERERERGRERGRENS